MLRGLHFSELVSLPVQQEVLSMELVHAKDQLAHIVGSRAPDLDKATAVVEILDKLPVADRVQLLAELHRLVGSVRSVGVSPNGVLRHVSHDQLLLESTFDRVMPKILALTRTMQTLDLNGQTALYHATQVAGLLERWSDRPLNKVMALLVMYFGPTGTRLERVHGRDLIFAERPHECFGLLTLKNYVALESDQVRTTI
jgi:hypothetical protein